MAHPKRATVREKRTFSVTDAYTFPIEEPDDNYQLNIEGHNESIWACRVVFLSRDPSLYDLVIPVCGDVVEIDGDWDGDICEEPYGFEVVEHRLLG